MITERKRGEIFVHQSGAICVRCWPRRRSYSFGDQILPMWQIYEATNHSTAFRTVWTAQIWSFPFWFGPRSYVILNQVQVWSFEQLYLNSWDFYVTEHFTESLVARRRQTEMEVALVALTARMFWMKSDSVKPFTSTPPSTGSSRLPLDQLTLESDISHI